MGQNPQRQANQASFDQQGWDLNDADMEAVFRFLARFFKNPGELQIYLDTLDVNDLTVNDSVSGDAVHTTVEDPGIDTVVVSEQGIREFVESRTVEAGKASWAEFFAIAGLV